MRKTFYAGGCALSVLAFASLIPAAVAQETTSAIRGSILTETGEAVSGATVTIVHTPSGTRTVTTTNADGTFDSRGLRIGGPYTVTIEAPGLRKQEITEINLSVAEPFRLETAMAAEGAELDAIVVTASTLKRAISLETGSASTFSADDIAGVASATRDIRDALRRDPLVSFDPSNRSISIGGAIGRANRFSVDGVAIQDDFGLNTGGLPSIRGIVSLEAIDQVAVNSAPFDIAEGNLQGGSINAILKSGTNNFKASAFYIHGSDGLTGDNIRGRDVALDFTFRNYGAFVSGPIIEDKLFFAVGFERLRDGFPSSSIGDTGIAGEGFANVVPNIGDSATTADDRAVVNEVRDILRTVYNFDAGDVQFAVPEIDRKYSGKIDWNITDDHRLALTYIQHFNSVPFPGQGSSISATAPRIVLQSTGYEGTEATKVYTGQLNSSWSDDFTTELRVSYRDYERGQVPFGAPDGGPDFGQFNICTNRTSIGTGTNPTNNLQNCGNNALITLGPDQFRHANELAVTNLNGAFTANLRLQDHQLKLRAEFIRVKVDNLFVPNSDGQFYFDSITDLRNRNANQLIYANALTANPRDATAAFSYRQYTMAVQDTWDATDTLTLNFGLRYDLYDQDQNVVRNPNFINRYGFANTKTLNGLDLIQPRFGFNWDATDRLNVSGGAGVFGGGSPVVWVSNSYSNDGFRLNSITLNRTATGFTDAAVAAGQPQNPLINTIGASALNGVNGLSFPSIVDQYLGQGNLQAPPISNAAVNSIAPDFKVPSSWRFNLSAKYDLDLGSFGDGWGLRADLLATTVNNGLAWTDLRARPLGTLPDGRPRYDPTAGANSDIQLRNTKDGRAYFGSFSVSKDWDFGLSAGFAYTYSNVKDVVSNTNSSTANSGYDVAVRDPNNPELGRSTLEIRDNFRFRLGYRAEFFGDNETRIELFAEHRSGRPLSYTFSDNSSGTSVFPSGSVNCAGAARNCTFGTRGNGRYQIFVPNVSGPITTDSAGRPVAGIVTFANQATLDAMRAFIQGSVLNEYQGQIAPKGVDRNPSFTKLDIRVSQQVPFFWGKFTAFADVENFLNLLDKDWNSFRQRGDAVSLVQVSCLPNPANCQSYLYSNFNVPTLNAEQRASLWRVNLGIRYDF
jgi:outer membrane receptor protein involved in Fe transport